MFGRYVEYNGIKVWVNCTPQTSGEELHRRAKRIVEQQLKLESVKKAQ